MNSAFPSILGGTIDIARLEFLNANPVLDAMDKFSINLDSLDSFDEHERGNNKGRTRKAGAPRDPALKRHSNVTVGDLDPLLFSTGGAIDPSLLALLYPAETTPLGSTSAIRPAKRSEKSTLERASRAHSIRKLKSRSAAALESAASRLEIEQRLAVPQTDSELQHNVDQQRLVVAARAKEEAIKRQAAAAACIELRVKDKMEKQEREFQERMVRDRQAQVERRVQEYLDRHRRLTLLKALSGWRNVVLRDKRDHQQFIAQSRWRAMRHAFCRWRQAATQVRNQREARQAAQQLRLQAERDARATRHFQTATLSRAFVCWAGFVRIARHERQVAAAHRNRQLKMRMILASLAAVPVTAENAHEIGPGEDTGAAADHPELEQVAAAAQPLPPRPLKPTPPKPKMLTAMELREQRRLELKREREERQRSAAIAAAEAKLAAERALVERERAEALLAKEAKARAIQEAEAFKQRMAAISSQAIAHAATTRVKRCIRHWRTRLAARIQSAATAEEWCAQQLKQNAVRLWQDNLNARWRALEAQIDQVRAQSLATRALRHWRERVALASAQTRIAREHQVRQTLRFALGTWQQWAKEAKRVREHIEECNNIKADAMAARVVPRRVFKLWRQFVTDAKDTRWQEYRRASLRNKVRGWLDKSTSSFSRLCNEATIVVPELQMYPYSSHTMPPNDK
ncbi:hypothetical protein BC828DRAFT_437534 [Blastocladiella britannica]|nr:hypothetical protein BC828DRAFT_437534 [Blastocladiella britannica]